MQSNAIHVLYDGTFYLTRDTYNTHRRIRNLSEKHPLRSFILSWSHPAIIDATLLQATRLDMHVCAPSVLTLTARANIYLLPFDSVHHLAISLPRLWPNTSAHLAAKKMKKKHADVCMLKSSASSKHALDKGISVSDRVPSLLRLDYLR